MKIQPIVNLVQGFWMRIPAQDRFKLVQAVVGSISEVLSQFAQLITELIRGAARRVARVLDVQVDIWEAKKQVEKSKMQSDARRAEELSEALHQIRLRDLRHGRPPMARLASLA